MGKKRTIIVNIKNSLNVHSQNKKQTIKTLTQLEKERTILKAPMGETVK